MTLFKSHCTINNIVNQTDYAVSEIKASSWTEPMKDTQTDNTIQFEGDSSEFTPYIVNTMRSRVEQKVVVDFYKKKFSHMQIRV